MAGSLDMYKDLLTPIKDPEKSFAVDIAQLLQDYVQNLICGKSAPNFNSAALILQGSSSIYGKKVEYLHNLATQLCNNLLKQKVADPNAPPKKDAPVKEKEKKEDKTNDPFLSVEIKPGKNLSCLRRKNTSKKDANKKPAKRVKSIVPLHLLSTDSEDKGDMFYDTRGEAIGNTGDYALNKCKLTTDGWLLISTVNPKLVPSDNSPPDYYNISNITSSDVGSVQENCETENNACSDVPIQASPDEGLGTDPASNGGSDLGIVSQPNTSEPSSPNKPTSNDMSVDEGIGGTPDEGMFPSHDSPVDIENVPAEENNEETGPALMPIRQSRRQALKLCQLSSASGLQSLDPVNPQIFLRRKIQKKNTRRLPEKLRTGISPPVCCISEYCARTFFSMDDKHLMKSLLFFDCDGLEENSKFLNRMIARIKTLKNNKTNKKIQPIEDEREIDVEEIETPKDADEPDADLYIPFDDADVQIDNNPKIPESEAPQIPEDVFGPEDPVEVQSPDISHIAHEEHMNYLKEVQQFVQNADITERVHEWEQSVKPFLEELEHRESFDINLYGSRILNSFEDNNRKQTKTFRQFCKNKEKWEIHRLFMALLPLANVGNVSIESERKEDGSDEIFVTLLSRKMHHKELEEFGHNDGSHP